MEKQVLHTLQADLELEHQLQACKLRPLCKTVLFLVSFGKARAEIQ